MFNQFHDILGGTSIKEAYFDAYNGLGRAIETAKGITHYALQSINKKMKTLGKNPENPWNVVVWNLNETAYDGYIEAEVQWLHEFKEYEGGIALEDETGKRYDCQIVLEKSVIPGFRSRFLFKANIPALGYKSFKVIQTGEKASLVDKEEHQTIATKYFDVAFDNNTGFIDTFKHKTLDIDFGKIIDLTCLEDLGDTWCFNVKGYGKSLGEFTLKEIQVVESGIFRTVIKAIYLFNASMVTLYYTFYEKEEYFDVRYVVNWNEKHTVLKLTLNTGKSALTVSSPFMTETRGETNIDAPMGEWLSCKREECSISVMADSLFSYTKGETDVALSILRSCIYGDLRLGELNHKVDYPYMEQGIAEGNIRVMIRPDNFVTAQVVAGAKSFNNPPIVIIDANHSGMLSSTDSFVKLQGESVSMSALKQSPIPCPR